MCAARRSQQPTHAPSRDEFGAMLITRHWFAALSVLLGMWVTWNLLSENEYDASLRPLYWVVTQLI
jgi:hypothetical protein